MKRAAVALIAGSLLATSCLLSPGQDLPSSNSGSRGDGDDFVFGPGTNDDEGGGDIAIGDGDSTTGSGDMPCPGMDAAGAGNLGGSCGSGGAGGAR